MAIESRPVNRPAGGLVHRSYGYRYSYRKFHLQSWPGHPGTVRESVPEAWRNRYANETCVAGLDWV
jgi:hypothetical protein